jgi:hypothetical protein
MERISPSDIRTRRRIEFCIDAFAAETGYVPADAFAVRDAGELSPQLERLVGSLTATTGWRAWLEGSRSWFVQGRLADCSAKMLQQPLVYLVFRDQDAVPVTAGLWLRSGPSRWDLMRSFSCDVLG